MMLLGRYRRDPAPYRYDIDRVKVAFDSMTGWPMTATSELAQQLLAARENATSVDASAEPWPYLTEQLALAISVELYARGGADASSDYKLAATDAVAQSRFGIIEPFLAPLLPAHVTTEVVESTLTLSDLIDPRFEPEVGLVISDAGIRPIACVEVPDCRFADWKLPPFGLTTDIGLQGRMLFGTSTVTTGSPVPDVDVEVWHDGEQVSSAHQIGKDIEARSAFAPQARARRLVRLASGSLTPMLPCEPGRWVFDIRPLGTITVHVV